MIRTTFLLLLVVVGLIPASCRPMLTKSNTTLQEAALFDRKDIVAAHLDDGLDVNSLDYFGRTPLHCAAQGGHTEMIRFLCSRGGNVNAIGLNGWTPLFTAVYGTRPLNTAKVLVELGADVTIRDTNGDKASDVADYMHDSETAAFLRSRGG